MKPTLILDCSITLAWCFADEGSDKSAAVQDRLVAEAAIVPSHWFLEVANVLLMAEKRKRISTADASSFVALLGTFDIQVDDQSAPRAFEHLIPLCRSHGLTAYDGAYLDLALRLQLPLASLDDDLCRAARQVGIQTFGG